MRKKNVSIIHFQNAQLKIDTNFQNACSFQLETKFFITNNKHARILLFNHNLFY